MTTTSRSTISTVPPTILSGDLDGGGPKRGKKEKGSRGNKNKGDKRKARAEKRDRKKSRTKKPGKGLSTVRSTDLVSTQ